MRQINPPLIAGASLPKRADSAKATCPAGTMGMDAAVPGASSDPAPGAASTSPGVNRLPREAAFGPASAPADGAVENKDMLPVCPHAAGATAKATAAATPNRARDKVQRRRVIKWPG